MFTFVVWAVGLFIVGTLALLNLSIIVAAFNKNAFLGFLVTAISVGIWCLIASVVL